jgi:hypothetical protein
LGYSFNAQFETTFGKALGVGCVKKFKTVIGKSAVSVFDKKTHLYAFNDFVFMVKYLYFQWQGQLGIQRSKLIVIDFLDIEWNEFFAGKQRNAEEDAN